VLDYTQPSMENLTGFIGRKVISPIEIERTDGIQVLHTVTQRIYQILGNIFSRQHQPFTL